MDKLIDTTALPRCERCQFRPRWCICAGWSPLELPFRLDVLMHMRESWRPSSTGHLITRTVVDSHLHLFRRGSDIDRGTVVVPGKRVWILHPQGSALPTLAPGETLQVFLLDGSWGEAADMRRAAADWGEIVGLPLVGQSRYWLRKQREDGQFSTIEALLGLLAALGLSRERTALELQFELHVYAGLLARGRKIDAANYLFQSPIRDAFPEIVSRLNPGWAGRR